MATRTQDHAKAPQASTDASLDTSQENSLHDEPAPVVAQPETAPPVSPDGGYGWVCCFAVFLINAHTWGINSAYGVLLAHFLTTNTFPGATHLDFAFVAGLSLSMAQLISPIATISTRKFGTRVTLLIGVFFETLALIGASFAKETWHLFLSQGICFGWGMGLLFTGSVGVIPQWFTTRRSFANGVATSGTGIGGLIYSLATGAIIQNIGVGWAYRILGICAFSVNLMSALLVRDRNKQIGSSQLAFDYTLLKRKEYLLLLGFGILSILGYVVLLFSLPNYATSIGLTAHQGSIVSAILNLGQALGRPPIGYFSDSFGRLNMAALMTFLAGLFSLVIWTNASSYGVLILFALVGGMVGGVYWSIVAPVTTEVIGLSNLPSALCITWLSLVIPTTFSEAIALQIAGSSGGYLGTQLFAGFMFMGAATLMWILRAWKIGHLEHPTEKTEVILRRSFVARLFAIAKV
ncbi:major facilitator superfamily domain-containing protein [Phyllosticta capitalensis]|uniref:Major facilitator superfamily domain-containing protein n=2 Tax=Phyllosticta capitalensis TaxID=121624 RepID=A0ABR1Z3J2_9PEZI